MCMFLSFFVPRLCIISFFQSSVLYVSNSLLLSLFLSLSDYFTFFFYYLILIPSPFNSDLNSSSLYLPFCSFFAFLRFGVPFLLSVPFNIQLYPHFTPFSFYPFIPSYHVQSCISCKSMSLL